MVETKTRAYDDRHLARVCDQAAWLSRRRRRWCRRGAVPVVCLVRARGVQRLERNVLVVSIDRLIPVLRSAAGGVGASAPRRCPRAAELSERSTHLAGWRTTTRGVGSMTGFPTFNANLGVTGRAVYRAEGDPNHLLVMQELRSSQEAHSFFENPHNRRSDAVCRRGRRLAAARVLRSGLRSVRAIPGRAAVSFRVAAGAAPGSERSASVPSG